jgi:hypothetical protein
MTVAPSARAGWRKVAAAVADAIPFEELDQVWLFPPVRKDDREWGTAVVARRLDAQRRRVYTVTYLVMARGRTRGEGKVVLEEVGDSPSVVVQDVIAGVQARMGDDRPPEALAPEAWSAFYHTEEEDNEA